MIMPNNNENGFHRIAKVKNIAKNHDNVCKCAQKVLSLRKITNIISKKQ